MKSERSKYPEIWKAYPKNPKYEVSTEGRVRSTRKDGSYRLLEGRYRYNDGLESYVVTIGQNRYRCLKSVVWETFKGEIPDAYRVINKNGCKTMCELTNLALEKRNNKSGSKKVKVINLDTGEIYDSITNASKALHASNSTIHRIINGQIKNSSVGFKLAFYKESKPITTKEKRKRGRPKNTGKKIFDCEKKVYYNSIKECAEKYNVSTTTVYFNLINKRHSMNVKYYKVWQV